MRIHGKDSLFTLASAAHWCPPGAVLSVLSIVFSFGSFPWVTSWPPQAIWARTVLVQASRKGEDLLLNHVLSFVSALWPWRLLRTGGLRQFPRPPWWPELPAALARNKLLASLWEICNQWVWEGACKFEMLTRTWSDCCHQGNSGLTVVGWMLAS